MTRLTRGLLKLTMSHKKTGEFGFWKDVVCKLRARLDQRALSASLKPTVHFSGKPQVPSLLHARDVAIHKHYVNVGSPTGPEHV